MNINYSIKADDPKWVRALAFLRALGASEPEIDHYCSIVFFKGVGFHMGIVAKFPGVAATDLFRNGLIQLSDEVTKLGGVPNLPIDELERILPKLVRCAPGVGGNGK